MQKVLIVTYYWPPSGGGGVQRWLKFAQYLPNLGFEVFVIAPQNASYPLVDKKMEGEVNGRIHVKKVPIWEPYSLLNPFKKKAVNKNQNQGITLSTQKKSFKKKVIFWLRGNILIPDPRVFWVKNVKREAKRLILSENIQTVITTGPPHSVHLSGLSLKKKLGLKWIADFRDPWSEIDYLDEFYLSAFALKLQKRLEYNVLSKANCVLTVSENWASDLKRLGANQIKVITNGFDDKDFESFKSIKPQKFVISHIGFLSAYRIPKTLFKVLEELCAEDSNFANKLELRFVGLIEDSVKTELKTYTNLKKCVTYLNYLPHNEVMDLYGSSYLLLLLLNNTGNAKGHIPGKLFEYLASKKRILAVGPKDGDVASILQKTESGSVVHFNDRLEMKNLIRKFYTEYLNDSTLNTNRIEDYSRKKLTENLADLLNGL